MKALVLLSSGIDSPVAAYLIKKKGVEVVAVHMSDAELTDEVSLKKTKRIAKKIGIKKLYVVNHGSNKIELLKKCRQKYLCVLCKRMMLRIAENIAKKEKCDFLITGENLGQVASQTLSNLVTLNNAVKMPVLRPLLSFDKNETVEIAKKIGTYEISIEPGISCSVVPPNPVTKSETKEIEKIEENVDVQGLVQKSLKTAALLKL